MPIIEGAAVRWTSSAAPTPAWINVAFSRSECNKGALIRTGGKGEGRARALVLRRREWTDAGTDRCRDCSSHPDRRPEGLRVQQQTAGETADRDNEAGPDQ